MIDPQGNGIVERANKLAKENEKLKRKVLYWRLAWVMTMVGNLLWAWRLLK